VFSLFGHSVYLVQNGAFHIDQLQIIHFLYLQYSVPLTRWLLSALLPLVCTVNCTFQLVCQGVEWCEWNWLRSQLEMPAGLNNLGNTCYMNATLQCLRSVPELRDAIKKYDRLITSVVCWHYLTLDANHLLALIMMLMCLCWFHFCCLTFAAGFMQNLWKQLCGVDWCLKTNWENQPVLEVGETALWYVRGFVDNFSSVLKHMIHRSMKRY